MLNLYLISALLVILIKIFSLGLKYLNNLINKCIHYSYILLIMNMITFLGVDNA